ncbi:MAG: LPXTG cell wall anchor domain-containing protein [Nocardioides sp.]
MRRSARSTSVVAATLLIMSFGSVSTAFADPGNGNGAGSDNAQAVAANNGNGNANGAANADNGNGNGAANGNGNGNGAGADDATVVAASNNGNGNGGGNGNSNGGGNGNGNAADSGAGVSAAAASTGSGSATKAKGNGSSAKGSSSKGSSAKGSSSKGNAGDHKTKGTAGTSGDPKNPQPVSGADDNPGGANGQCADANHDGYGDGVYCSTRDGSPSMNGQGKGKATGKPCAGCVGKADNKNPKGQMPGPSDKNAGYECDRNNGIGKTNPAHTGCKAGTPPDCVDQPGKPCTPPPPCVPTPANYYCGVPQGCVPSPSNNYCGVPQGCVPMPENNYCIPPASCVPNESNDYCGAGGPECEPPAVVGPNGECIFGEEEILCPDGSVMPPSGKCDKVRPPTVRGEEAFRPRPNAGVSQPQAGVLPATGANSGLGLLTGAGFVMLAIGAGAMLRRRTD